MGGVEERRTSEGVGRMGGSIEKGRMDEETIVR
jgi:hypothetical protein